MTRSPVSPLHSEFSLTENTENADWPHHGGWRETKRNGSGRSPLLASLHLTVKNRKACSQKECLLKNSNNPRKPRNKEIKMKKKIDGAEHRSKPNFSSRGSGEGTGFRSAGLSAATSVLGDGHAGSHRAGGSVYMSHGHSSQCVLWREPTVSEGGGFLRIRVTSICDQPVYAALTQEPPTAEPGTSQVSCAPLEDGVQVSRSHLRMWPYMGTGSCRCQ